MKTPIDVLDFHAHVLPKADHGSLSVNMTRFQLASALKHGCTRIIATPHFYPNQHSVSSFLQYREASYLRMKSRIVEPIPDIRLGAEVMICNGLEDMPDLDKLFIQGTNTLLLELPFTDFQPQFSDTVYKLVSRGIDVVMAHVDRYPEKSIEYMLDAGARLQINAESVSRFFMKKHLLGWIADGKVIALGSDIHKKDGWAYHRFARAVKTLGSLAEGIRIESDKIWNKSTPYDIA